MIFAAAALSGLIGILQGVGPEREQAIQTLADTSLSLTLTVLTEANWRGRDAAVQSLAQRQPPQIEPLLEVSREHGKIATRRAAIRALGDLPNPGLCDSLMTLLVSGSDSVILDAVTGRVDCRADDFAPYLHSPDADTRRRAFSAYEEAGGGSSERYAIEFLDDPHHGVRHVAKTYLVSRGSGSLAAIGSVYGDLSRVGKSVALDLLGQIGGEVATERLMEAMSDQDWVIRRAATANLVRMDEGGLRERLISLMQTEDNPLVRDALDRAVEGSGQDNGR